MTKEQPKTVDVTTHLLVTPTWSEWHEDENGHPLLDGGRVQRATMKRPGRMPREGGVVVKLTLRLPASAFLPLSPVALVEFEEGQTETVQVLVEAPDVALDAES